MTRKERPLLRVKESGREAELGVVGRRRRP